MTFNILNSVYKDDAFFKGVGKVYTIHNLDYQGRQSPKILKNINYNIDKLASIVDDIKDGDVNFMVQGILNADIITTVSPSYAKEILTKEFGAGLDNILKARKKDLYGILNGIDINFFNPAKDKNIKQRYSIASLNKKAINKLWLQKKTELALDKKLCLVGFISRLAWQKGIELIGERLLSLDCQFVVLGTGERKYEDKLKKLAQKYPRRFSAQIKFDTALAQQIYAGADIMLVPSRYEPCGLIQMIAMRYGTVPVVRRVGGLKDTVNKKVGFTFKEFKTEALYKILKRALSLYYKEPREWRRLQIRGMKQDFSWENSAKKYIELYFYLMTPVL